MPAVSIQVNPTTVANESIKNMVGADNYERISDNHIKVFGRDAKEPQWVYLYAPGEVKIFSELELFKGTTDGITG